MHLSELKSQHVSALIEMANGLEIFLGDFVRRIRDGLIGQRESVAHGTVRRARQRRSACVSNEMCSC